MRQKYLKIAMIVIATIVFNGLMTGCVEKDVYNPDAGKQPLPDPDEYFGFETRGDVKLLVNYNVPGFTYGGRYVGEKRRSGGYIQNLYG